MSAAAVYGEVATAAASGAVAAADAAVFGEGAAAAFGEGAAAVAAVPFRNVAAAPFEGVVTASPSEEKLLAAAWREVGCTRSRWRGTAREVKARGHLARETAVASAVARREAQAGDWWRYTLARYLDAQRMLILSGRRCGGRASGGGGEGFFFFAVSKGLAAAGERLGFLQRRKDLYVVLGATASWAEFHPLRPVNKLNGLLDDIPKEKVLLTPSN